MKLSIRTVHLLHPIPLRITRFQLRIFRTSSNAFQPNDENKIAHSTSFIPLKFRTLQQMPCLFRFLVHIKCTSTRLEKWRVIGERWQCREKNMKKQLTISEERVIFIIREHKTSVCACVSVYVLPFFLSLNLTLSPKETRKSLGLRDGCIFHWANILFPCVAGELTKIFKVCTDENEGRDFRISRPCRGYRVRYI